MSARCYAMIEMNTFAIKYSLITTKLYWNKQSLFDCFCFYATTVIVLEFINIWFLSYTQFRLFNYPIIRTMKNTSNYYSWQTHKNHSIQNIDIRIPLLERIALLEQRHIQILLVEQRHTRHIIWITTYASHY